MLFSPPIHLPLLGRRLGGLTASAALHAAVVLSAAGLAPQPAGGSQEPAGGPVVVAVAADVVRPAPSAEQRADGVEARPALEIAGVAVDFDKILACRDALFPFLTLDAPLWNRKATPQEERPASLRNPLATGARGSTRPPLRLNDRALQALVDSAWSRRER